MYTYIYIYIYIFIFIYIHIYILGQGFDKLSILILEYISFFHQSLKRVLLKSWTRSEL